MLRKRPVKKYYLRLRNEEGLRVFHLKNRYWKDYWVKEGAVEITKEEYDKYEKKGIQPASKSVVSTPRRKRNAG